MEPALASTWHERMSGIRGSVPETITSQDELKAEWKAPELPSMAHDEDP